MPKKKAEDFGNAFKELEEIAEWFEREEPDLDKGLAKFERAMELTSLCKVQLAQAEQKIVDIKNKAKNDD